MARARTYSKPWTEGLRELFDLVPAAWRPPETVSVRKTARTLTVMAVFKAPDGHTWKASSRAVLQGGDWVNTDEGLGSRFIFGGPQ